MREKSIEQKLVKAVKAAGGICPKLIAPGMDGMPDRILLLPGCRIGFVEVKAPGKRPRPRQRHLHRLLRTLGFPVFVMEDPDQADRIVKEVSEWHR